MSVKILGGKLCRRRTEELGGVSKFHGLEIWPVHLGVVIEGDLIEEPPVAWWHDMRLHSGQMNGNGLCAHGCVNVCTFVYNGGKLCGSRTLLKAYFGCVIFIVICILSAKFVTHVLQIIDEESEHDETHAICVLWWSSARRTLTTDDYSFTELNLLYLCT